MNIQKLTIEQEELREINDGMSQLLQKSQSHSTAMEERMANQEKITLQNTQTILENNQILSQILKASLESTQIQQDQKDLLKKLVEQQSNVQETKKSGHDITKDSCFECGDFGHWARQCPQKTYGVAKKDYNCFGSQAKISVEKLESEILPAKLDRAPEQPKIIAVGLLEALKQQKPLFVESQFTALGQPQKLSVGELFGGPAKPQKLAASALFGGPAKPQEAAGSLFGNKPATQLFGGVSGRAFEAQSAMKPQEGAFGKPAQPIGQLLDKIQKEIPEVKVESKDESFARNLSKDLISVNKYLGSQASSLKVLVGLKVIEMGLINEHQTSNTFGLEKQCKVCSVQTWNQCDHCKDQFCSVECQSKEICSKIPDFLDLLAKDDNDKLKKIILKFKKA